MSPEEKLEMGKKLIAEAEAEIAAKKRNWPERIEPGMCFGEGESVWIADDRGSLVKVVGSHAGMRWDDWSQDLMPRAIYLGSARDLIKIADDAHEPTGEELVGELCEFSDGNGWSAPQKCTHGPRYKAANGLMWKRARLAR